MLDCKAVNTPMNIDEKLKFEGEDLANASEFRSLVGRLIYITHTIGLVSRFMQNLHSIIWELQKGFFVMLLELRIVGYCVIVRCSVPMLVTDSRVSGAVNRGTDKS